MDNQNDKDFKIFLKGNGWIPVSREFFREFSQMNNTVRRRMQRHKCCVCPPGKTWLCDSDCLSCEFYRGGENLSLDREESFDEGQPVPLYESIPDPSTPLEDIVTDKLLLDLLYTKIRELDPDLRKLIELILEEKSEREIISLTGISVRKTLYNRKKNAIEQLRMMMDPEENF